MLYHEFLEGTGAVDNQASYDEYKRVEAFYMACDGMTKEDVYRMAKVETVAQHEARMEKAREDELAWVMQNIIPAAAFIRGMSEKKDYFRRNFVYASECGNCFEIREVRAINGRSIVLYEFWCNGKQLDTKSTGYGLLPSAEFQSYRADWHDKSLKELEDLFGYIA